VGARDPAEAVEVLDLLLKFFGAVRAGHRARTANEGVITERN
jgi:hypothetical protein